MRGYFVQHGEKNKKISNESFCWSEAYITIQQDSPSAMSCIQQPQKSLNSLFELLDLYVLPLDFVSPSEIKS